MSNQLPPLAQGLGGKDAAPLVLAVNDRLRRISLALAANAGATGTAGATGPPGPAGGDTGDVTINGIAVTY